MGKRIAEILMAEIEAGYELLADRNEESGYYNVWVCYEDGTTSIEPYEGG